MEESKIRVGEFRNSRGDHYGFNYYFETVLNPKEGVIVPLPQVTPNKRSVNDIGWMVTSSKAKIYGTLSPKPEANLGKDALWQEIIPGDDVNKVISGMKVFFDPDAIDEDETEPDETNEGETSDKTCTVIIRVIMC